MKRVFNKLNNDITSLNSNETKLLSYINNAGYYKSSIGLCTNASGISGNAYVCKVSDRYAFLLLNLLPSTVISNSTLATIPDGFRPKNAVTTYAIQSGTTARTVTINTNGTIVSTAANVNFLCFAAYVHADNQEQPYSL